MSNLSGPATVTAERAGNESTAPPGAGRNPAAMIGSQETCPWSHSWCTLADGGTRPPTDMVASCVDLPLPRSRGFAFEEARPPAREQIHVEGAAWTAHEDQDNDVVAA